MEIIQLLTAYLLSYCSRLYLATGCLTKICLHGNVFIEPLPSSVSIHHITLFWQTIRLEDYYLLGCGAMWYGLVCHIPGDSTLHSHWCGNVTYYWKGWYLLRKKNVWPILKYYPSISLLVLRKTSVRKVNFWNDVWPWALQYRKKGCWPLQHKMQYAAFSEATIFHELIGCQFQYHKSCMFECLEACS
jgi:hypothetical protein